MNDFFKFLGRIWRSDRLLRLSQYAFVAGLISGALDPKVDPWVRLCWLYCFSVQVILMGSMGLRLMATIRRSKEKRRHLDFCRSQCEAIQDQIEALPEWHPDRGILVEKLRATLGRYQWEIRTAFPEHTRK